MESVLFKPKRALIMFTGKDTAAMVRGAIDAYQPAALRLSPNASIISGMSGPADAQLSPRQKRMRTIVASIMTRKRLLLFK